MSTYEFPMRPVPAVGAIVFRGSQVLLVRRRDPPSQGRWSIPGGAVEVGETVEQAVVRETREETAVEVRPREVVAVADFIEKEGARIRWHYVLVDLLCVHIRGEPFAGSDAENARFIETRELGTSILHRPPSGSLNGRSSHAEKGPTLNPEFVRSRKRLWRSRLCPLQCPLSRFAWFR